MRSRPVATEKRLCPEGGPAKAWALRRAVLQSQLDPRWFDKKRARQAARGGNLQTSCWKRLLGCCLPAVKSEADVKKNVNNVWFVSACSGVGVGSCPVSGRRKNLPFRRGKRLQQARTPDHRASIDPQPPRHCVSIPGRVRTERSFIRLPFSPRLLYFSFPFFLLNTPVFVFLVVHHTCQSTFLL